jgi:hypothetical protein
MKKTRILCVWSVMMLLAGSVFAALPTVDPLIYISFAGDDLENDGSLSADGWMNDGSTPTYIPGVAADLNGNTSSRAMNNMFTDPTQCIGLTVGNNTAGSPGEVAAALNGAVSLTVCGWWYVPSSGPGLGQNASGFKRRNNAAAWDYNYNTMTDVYGRARSYINNTLANHPPFTYWNAEDAWVFVAMTYNSATGELKQYRSYSTVSLVEETYALSVGPLADSDYGVYFGDRDWFCYMDNLRVYASKTDDSGTLTYDELTSIFEWEMVNEVPEPATVTLLVLGSSLLLRRRRA